MRMDQLSDGTLRIIGIVTILVIYFIRRRIKNAEFNNAIAKIPGPTYFPIVGCLPAFIEAFRNDMVDFLLKEMPKRYGPYIRFWIFNDVQVLISSARGIEPILRCTIFNFKSDNYDFFKPYLGNGLISATDPTWKIHRKLLNPTFHVGILQDYIPIFVKNAKTMCENLTQANSTCGEQGFDIMPLVGLCSLDIIAETSMGIEINTQNNENVEFGDAINRGNDLLAQRYLSIFLRVKPFYYFSSNKREYERLVKYATDFSVKVITERKQVVQQEMLQKQNSTQKKEQIEGVKRRRSLLDAMLVAEKEGIVSEQDIIDEVNTFMSAGYDTVSASTSYTLFLLGTYPQIQERVVTELEEVFGDSGRIPDMNDLSRLKYLDRCIKESLRIYPPVGLFERYINQDVYCENYLIPKGCKVSIVPHIVHRDPEFWPEPEKFDPDRFLPENIEKRHPYSYIPFSLGHRNCIGQKFAMTEEKVLLSTVLRRFKVEAAQTRESLKLELAIVMRPKDGIKMRLHERLDKPKLKLISQ